MGGYQGSGSEDAGKAELDWRGWLLSEFGKEKGPENANAPCFRKEEQCEKFEEGRDVMRSRDPTCIADLWLYSMVAEKCMP
jgi:hypothetical protein